MVLEGVKVLEVSEGFAGPFCGLQLADAGAQVTKIEPIDGDFTRQIGPFTNGQSQVFMSLNRGKQSITLDQSTDQGRQRLKVLLVATDILITHPQSDTRPTGIEYGWVREVNPAIIFCEVTDYGNEGALKDHVGSELTVQAASGIWRFLGDMTTKEARKGLIEPIRVGAYLASSMAGMFLFQAALSALYLRRKSGLGQKVGVSLLGTMIAIQTQNWAAMGNPDSWDGFELIGQMALPETGFVTKDGVVNALLYRANNEKLRQFLSVNGVDPDDPRLKTTYSRGRPPVFTDMSRLELLAKVFKNLTTEEACRTINEDLEGLCTPVLDYSQVVSHPQVQHLGNVIAVDNPGGGSFHAIGHPWHLGVPFEPSGRPPLLGEHNAMIADMAHTDDVSQGRKAPVPSGPVTGGPLEGLRVADFSGYAVGPWAGSLLGMLGAQVIKIDPPQGDGILSREPTQNGVPTPYMAFNQGKAKCAKLNLKDADKEVAVSLAKEADVLIENFRPGVMDRLGLGYEELSKLNDRLIYCSASGYGRSGPLSQWGAVADAIQGISGFAARNGSVNGSPELLRFYSPTDLVTSVELVSAALLALLVRSETGRGQWVQTTMIESDMHLQTSRFAEYFGTGRNPPRLASALPNIVPDQAFETSDGFVAVSARNKREWNDLMEVLGLPELAADQRFGTNEDRVANRTALTSLLQDRFRRFPSLWWFKQCSRHKVPCGIYLTPEEIMREDHYYQNDFIVTADVPIAGRMYFGGAPFLFSLTPARNIRPAVGVIPAGYKGFLNRSEYPDGFQGEHTELIKMRARNGERLFD